MVTEEIDLQALTDETFAGLCHLILLQEHGTVYRPLAGEGGDEGVDGFIEDFSIVYQIKFFKARRRLEGRPVEDWRDVHKIIKFQYVLEDLSLHFVGDEKGRG